MKRNSLLLASVGGAAVLAVGGVALGVNAADSSRVGDTALAAVTAGPTTTPAPGGSATSGTTPAPGTSGAPSSGAPASGAPSGGGSPAGAAVNEQRAGEIALAKAGGGRIVEIEAEQEHDRPVWSVEIVAGDTEHEVDVDRDNGTVVNAEQEPVDDDGDDRGDDEDDQDDQDDDTSGDDD